jgi:hypothetical protein
MVEMEIPVKRRERDRRKLGFAGCSDHAKNGTPVRSTPEFASSAQVKINLMR